MTQQAQVLVQVAWPQDDCALVTLNRPQAKNALSLALRRELVRVFTQELAGRARVVVLTGAGDAFCAGLDLKELGSVEDPRSAVVPEPANDPVLAVRRFDGPVIGAVNGPAVTGGFELALACDLLLAAESARFADTHARVGVLPGWGLSQLLPRRIGIGRAKQMAFSAQPIAARQALEWGLVNAVLPAAELLPAALRLAGDMLAAAPGMLAAYKRLIDDGAELALGAALRLESERSAAWAQGLQPDEVAQRGGALLRRDPQEDSSRKESA